MAQERSGCLLGWLLGTPELPQEESLPDIRVSKKFISEAEANLYRVLCHVMGDQGIVLMQVALNQLLYFPGKGSTRAIWRNRIAQRSIDFLIVDPTTMRPLVAIELDDATHTRPSRQTRDEHVEQALAAAKLPLLHILPSRSYSTEEIWQSLIPYINGHADA